MKEATLKRTPGRWPLVAVLSLALLLPALATLGMPGRLAPIMLWVALPCALALSPCLRRDPTFPWWILFIVPASVGLWLLSAGKLAPWLFGVSSIGAAMSLRAKGEAKRFLAALAVLVSLVSYFSSGAGGSGPMIGWYERFGLGAQIAEALTFAFRKAVHYTFYGCVAWMALKASRDAGAEPKEAIRTGLLAALSVASFDEVRQSGYANRNGSVWDVLLDLVGAATFVGLSEWRRAKAR